MYRLIALGFVLAACAPSHGQTSPDRPPVMAVSVEPRIEPSVDVAQPPAAPKRAAAQAGPTFHYDRQTLAEIEWAKGRFPNELADVHFGSLINELRAWLPPAEPLEVYARTPDHDCVLSELSRPEDISDEIRVEMHERQRDNHDFISLFRLNLKLNITYEDHAGPRARQYRTASVEHAIDISNDRHWDMLVDDEWVPQSAGGRNDSGPSSGVLSGVDDGAAYFEGIALDAWPTCTGMVQLRCHDGSTRECTSCSIIALRLDEVMPSSAVSATPSSACDMRCPPITAPPDLHRANELFSNVDVFRMPLTHPSPPHYALYRDRARCASEGQRPTTR